MMMRCVSWFVAFVLVCAGLYWLVEAVQMWRSPVLEAAPVRAPLGAHQGWRAPSLRDCEVAAGSDVLAPSRGQAARRDDSVLDALPLAGPEVSLRGTIVSHDARLCRAVIACGGEEAAVRVGGGVGGARLVSVYRRGAVLERAGRRVALLFDGAERSGKPAVHRQQAVYDAMSYTLEREEFQNIVRSPSAVLRQAAMTPGREKGRGGFRVQWVQDGGFFARLGLRQGDFITAVNGRQVTSLSEALGLMDELGREHFEVELLRNGARRALVVDVR
jgi:type II secretion system protein C